MTVYHHIKSQSFLWIKICFIGMILMVIGCQEPSGLDTDRITKIIDSTKIKPTLITPTLIRSELAENVPGIISLRPTQDSALIIPIDETASLPHSLTKESFIKIDTSNGRIRYTGNLRIIVEDTLSDVLPGNLDIPRYTRLHSINITLDSLPNDIDIESTNGVQRKEIQAEFIAFTNGTSSKKAHKLLGIQTTTVQELLGSRFSVLHLTAVIPLSQPITISGLTIAEFTTDFTVLVFW